MDVSILIVRLALAAVFAVAALAKFSDLGRFRHALERFGLSGRLAEPAGVFFPVAELAVAAMLVPVGTARWAALSAVVLLAAFSAVLVRVVVRGETVDCNCFGSFGSARVGRGTLGRNGVLLAMAGFVTIAGWSDGGASAFAWIGGHAALAAVVGVVAIVTAAHLAFSWQLFRQNGRLLDRVSALEAGHGSGNDGLAVGEPAPYFALPDLDGQRVALEDLLTAGRGVLLVFIDPACVHCNPLLPALGRAQADPDGTPVALISNGAVHDNRANAEEHGIVRVLLQDEFEVAESYHVYGSPGAVLVDAAGRIAAERKSGAKAVAAVLEDLAPPAPGLAAGVYADAGRQ